MTGVGKRVGDELYVHLSAVEHLAETAHQSLIQDAIARLPGSARADVNVAKINLRSARVSLLEYRAFDENPFPALAKSWSRDPSSGSAPVQRSYADSLNPPILHRKELLVHPSHPERRQWSDLTEAAESLGLFDDARTIGFQMNWERLVASKGYQLVGQRFVPLGNFVDEVPSADAPTAKQPVQRHLTALARSAISAPVQLLLRHGLLVREVSFFDYGCGRGDDVASLATEGFVATGWDPHYAADREVAPADVVNLGFVINVIEDPAERVEALQRAFGFSRQVMSVGVMLYGPETPGRPYRDGLLTGRSTFQKYFSQSEFKAYIEDALNQEAFLVGPGIAFVFSDKEYEQRFQARRYRAKSVGNRLLVAAKQRARERARQGTSKITNRSGAEPADSLDSVIMELAASSGPNLSANDRMFEEMRPQFDGLWALALDLGRYPEPEEACDHSLVGKVGNWSKVWRLLSERFDTALLERSREARSNDLRLYFAMQHFSKRPRYRKLETRLQRDIKAFFGDYTTAQTAGFQLLTSAADPGDLLSACRIAAAQGLGWLDGEHSLQVQATLVERLPVVLRAYLACGLLLYGALGDADLVKIHIASGKLTLMEFEDFEGSALPRMTKRVKVNVRKQDYDIFEYGAGHAKPLLYRKSRYIDDETYGYAEQVTFDQALEATGLLSTEFGPSEEELDRELEARRLQIDGKRLIRSRAMPQLDQGCGRNFTYRQLIECGETQTRLGIANLPKSPDTYNALHDLATQLLDPVVDYFGSIRLTYGFCSAELGKHITKRVAPELDQHASFECSGSGRPICLRGGAACDFIVDDEDMQEVADWIIERLPFDRLYFYGSDRPIHLSSAPSEAREAYAMTKHASGRLVPRRYPAQGSGDLTVSRGAVSEEGDGAG